MFRNFFMRVYAASDDYNSKWTGQQIDEGIDIARSSAGISFTEAATRENINSGEFLSIILGKIKKWFTDLAVHLLSNSVHVYYGTCGDSGSTVAKSVTCAGFPTTLVAGTTIRVRFTYANTASAPTLSVNGSDAYAIMKYGTTAPDTYMWSAGAVVEFTFDGTYWIMHQGTLATTTYFGATKLSSSVSSTSTALAATPSAVRDAYNLAAEKATKVIYTATIATSNWATNSAGGYKATITVSGILESDTPVIGIVQTGTMSTDKSMLEAWANVSRIVTSADTLTVYAYTTKPTVNLPIQIQCVR